MDKNFTLPEKIDGLNTAKASFTFQGHLQQHPMQWHCTLQTLENVYTDKKAENGVTRMPLQQFIHIEKLSDNEANIHIGLAVKQIDEPTIRKAMIMINNYKNLRQGMHQYGTVYYYPEES